MKKIYLIGLISILGITKSYACENREVTKNLGENRIWYVNRKGVEIPNAFKNFNVAMKNLNALNAKCPNDERVMLRIATVYGVNKAAQVCLSKILYTKLSNDYTNKKINENDILSLLETGKGDFTNDIENTYIFNIEIPQNKNLLGSDPLIQKLIRCDMLTDLFKEDLWKKSFFGRQYYIKEDVVNNLNVYLTYVENIVEILLSSDSRDKKTEDLKRILSSLEKSNLPEDVKKYLQAKVKIEAQKPTYGKIELGQGAGPKVDAHPDGLYSLSVSLRSLTK